MTNSELDKVFLYVIIAEFVKTNIIAAVVEASTLGISSAFSISSIALSLSYMSLLLPITLGVYYSLRWEKRYPFVPTLLYFFCYLVAISIANIASVSVDGLGIAAYLFIAFLHVRKTSRIGAKAYAYMFIFITLPPVILMTLLYFIDQYIFSLDNIWELSPPF